MDGRISELVTDIRDLRAEALDADVEEWVNRSLRDVYTDIQLLKQDKAFEHFVLDYVQQEYENRASRTEPLCTCPNRCPVKEGRLPARIRAADSFDGGIRDYKQHHVGAPVVLKNAYREWRRLNADVIASLERIKTAMVRNELPSGAGQQDAVDETEQAAVEAD